MQAHDGRGARYARQIAFGGIGPAGQARLAAASVAIVGCGALGTHLADALARAGVGRLIVIDRDIVEWTNLQRQVLFVEDDAAQGAAKATAAAARLRRINADIVVEPRVLDLDPDDARDLAEHVDLILDGTDSFETRYLINDACVAAEKPWIYSAVVAATGMTMVCHAATDDGRGPCLRCVWPEPAPAGSVATCDTAGVVNGAVSVVTGLAATEALKLLTGAPTLSRELVTFDLWQGTFDTLAVARDPNCPACGRGELEWLDGDRTPAAARLCGRDTVQVRPAARGALDLAALAARWQLARAGTVALAPAGEFARLTTAGHTLTVFADGRALLHGTDDPALARSLYARFVGM